MHPSPTSPRPATIHTRTVYAGITELAREVGLSQGWVSKLLARGCGPGDIRQMAELARCRKEIRDARKGISPAGLTGRRS
jgi:hypothetical protein